MKYLLNLSLILLLAGCASFQNTAGKVMVTTAKTVDLAMKDYAAMVASGVIKPEQETNVKIAYSQYQLAMLAASNAYIAVANGTDKNVWAKASDALAASSGSLIALIQSFKIGGVK